MSNASNLSALANVLDDGSSGQFLKSTGSGGVAFDTVAAGATVYSSASDLPLTGNTVGDMAYVSAATTAKVVNQTTGSVSTEDATRLYIYSGTGWYSVAFITQNPTISTVQDASSNTTPFTLATDQTATVITITADDPEEVPLTYGYSVTDGSLNGSTVAQGTGSNSNVFTVTPHASNATTFEITFTASDGINQATSINEFSLSFVTIVTDSNHTTLLATATGTSDNNNITDSSSNNHSITVNGDSYAGTFSPYRSGNYSWKFDGSNDNIQIADSTDFDFGSGDFTIEGFYKFNDTSTSQYLISIGGGSSNNSHFDVNLSSGNWRAGGLSDYMVSGVNTGIDTNSFHHFSLVRSSNNLKFYIDGTQIGSTVDVTGQTFDCSGNIRIGGFHSTGSFAFNGYFRDIRLVKGTAITPPSGGPTEPLEAITNTVLLLCHAPYLKDGSSNDHSITINGSPTSEPFSPYDYTEYDAADHGGSIVINSTSAWVQSTVTAPSTGSFAVECWVYWDEFPSTSNGNNQSIISFKGSDNYYGVRLMYKSPSSEGFAVYANDSWFMSQSSSPLKAKVWYHAAITYDGTNLRLFVNGSLIDTKAFSTDLTNADLRIGNDGWWRMGLGKVSDVRYTRGSAVYTADFTPPTAPLSSTNAELHLKGTDASIIDKSQGANLKLVGNTTGSTTQAKFSNTQSMYFDGNGDYISISDDEAYGFGTDDWTIETWLYCTKTGGFNAIFDTRVGTGTEAGSFGLGMHTSGRVQMYSSANSPAQFLYPSSTLSFNTWQHLAVVKSSGTTTMYFNGTAASTTYSDSRNYGSSQPVQIGKDDTTSNYFGGYMQDFRISKGKAHYTANFTPPTAPLEG